MITKKNDKSENFGFYVCCNCIKTSFNKNCVLDRFLSRSKNQQPKL